MGDILMSKVGLIKINKNLKMLKIARTNESPYNTSIWAGRRTPFKHFLDENFANKHVLRVIM